MPAAPYGRALHGCGFRHEGGGRLGRDRALAISIQLLGPGNSGVQVGFGEDDANGNGVVDGAESPTAGVAGRASAVLQAPTGYSGIYRAWNLDLNGDNAPDDPWHFGTATQYPVLSADLNGDGQARWQEFGYQLRKGPMLSANSPAGQARVELSWTAVETSHWSRPRL